ncbi:MAG: methionyl-tRNA formyltransferase [Planctomycetota bacterium]|jgi:methionyl-tRNA formyltransferase|nr:methionyl-tRNA formyltransferase [Planctomycetota bacterium]
MRLVFAGSPPFAVDSFAVLLAQDEPPVALVTTPPRRAGRGRKEVANPLVEMAEAAGVPTLRPEKASKPDFLDELAKLEPDLCVVVSFGQILNQSFLDIPKLGCVNLHGSLLPRWRGASPIQAAIQAGDTETGVCLQKMVLALDAGAVLAESKLSISPRETAPELFARASSAGAELLVKFLNEMKDGPLPKGCEQNENQVTVCKKITSSDALADWSISAEEMDRRVRALTGWPCLRATLPDGEELKIWEAEITEGEGEPGTVLAADGEFVISCGSGALRLLKVQRPGKSAMTSREFLRGSRIEIDDSLGCRIDES